MILDIELMLPLASKVHRAHPLLAVIASRDELIPYEKLARFVHQ
jgi:hypothetical protein